MGSAAADAVFDIVRGICTIASGKIMFDVVGNTWMDLFRESCPQCNGHGTMTCPYCQGTKNLTARPMALVTNAEGKKKYVSPFEDHSECNYCGERTSFDFELDSYTQDDLDAERITSNFSAAMGGRQVLPYKWDPTAGVVKCDLCMGSCIVHRHTPNLRHFFGLEDDFFAQIHQRAGTQWFGRLSPRDNTIVYTRKADQLNFYMEYPAPRPAIMPASPESDVVNPPQQVHSILVPKKEPRKKGQQDGEEEEEEEEGEVYINKEDAFNISDYVLPQVDQDQNAPIGRAWP